MLSHRIHRTFKEVNFTFQYTHTFCADTWLCARLKMTYCRIPWYCWGVYRIAVGIRLSWGTMDTCDVFTNDSLGSMGMEDRYHPKVFTSPSLHAYGTQKGWPHENCILAIWVLRDLPLQPLRGSTVWEHASLDTHCLVCTSQHPIHSARSNSVPYQLQICKITVVLVILASQLPRFSSLESRKNESRARDLNYFFVYILCSCKLNLYRRNMTMKCTAPSSLWGFRHYVQQGSQYGCGVFCVFRLVRLQTLCLTKEPEWMWGFLCF